MNNQVKITGVVLAGGRSRRMERNKALMKIFNTPMIEHITATLREVCGEVCISAPGKNEYRFLNAPVYPDLITNSGPLGGIHSAFIHTDARQLFVMACDMPLMTKSVILRIINAVHDEDAVVPVDNQGIHPLCAAYSRSSLTFLEQSLKAGILGVKKFLNNLNVKYLPFDTEQAAPGCSPFYNVNTIDDYRSARKSCARKISS